MAYGNDFSSVQSADLQEKAAQQAGIHAALGHLLGTIQTMREQKNVEAQRGMQQQQFLAALKQREYENKIQQQQSALANKRLDVQQQVSQGYLDLGRQQLEMQKNGGTPSQVRDREFIINRATADADQGMFDSPQDVISKYPGIAPEMAGVLAGHSSDARKRINDAHQFGQNAAATLNRLNQIGPEMKALEAKHSWIGVQRSNDADSYSKLVEEKDKLQKAENLLRSNKNFSSLVTFDPSSGNFINAASGPSWKAVTASKVEGTDNTPSSWVTGSPDGASVTPSVQSLAPVSASASPFYGRVNQLIQSGMDPVEAKRRALAESISSSSGPQMSDPAMSAGPMGYNGISTLPP